MCFEKNFIIFLFLTLSIALYGCQSATKDLYQAMPEEMPTDFNFSVKFGYGKMNEIDTFKGTVTKDLIIDGTITTDLVLTMEEKAEIYEKMKEFDTSKTKILEPIKSSCMRVPFQEVEWNITLNGETVTYFLSEEYCEPTNDGKELLKLSDFVFELVKNRDEYKSLPASNGAYE